MKIFLDCEFTELSKNGELISIGLVSMDGRTFYAELNDYNKEDANAWVKSNVINNLLFTVDDDYCVRVKNKVKDAFIEEEADGEVELEYYYGFNTELLGNKSKVGFELRLWLEQFKEIQIVGDCLAYDWVHLVDLLGDAVFHIPSNMSYIPIDICTMFEMKNIDPDISRETFIHNKVYGEKHNALYDALVIRECYRKLLNI